MISRHEPLLSLLFFISLLFLPSCTMTDSPSQHDHFPRIENPRFQLAVDLIDAGKTTELRALLEAEPELLTHRAAEDGTKVGAYFAHPYLLWFVAENPTRHETLPVNIIEVTEVILEVATEQGVENLNEQMNDTLRLVASGSVARKQGQQAGLIALLCEHGADPNAAMDAALAEGEGEAVTFLLAQGAERSLPVLVFLEEESEIKALFRRKEPIPDSVKQKALMVASMQGHAKMTFLLCSVGYGTLSPTFYGEEDFHAHSTPLHQAAYRGHQKVVEELVRQGADAGAKDKLWGGVPHDWAEYGGHAELANYLKEIGPVTRGVSAALAGDLETLETYLASDPEAVNRWMPLYGGRMLDVLSNLNYRRREVGRTIRFLIGKGANPNLGSQADGSGESPLHLTASEGDQDLAKEVIDALLEGGADINRLGGVITGGTPLHNATIFQLRETGAHLIKRGAVCDLFLAAGNDRVDLVKAMFGPDGNLLAEAPRVPGLHPEESAEHRINWAFFIAAEAGSLEVLTYLRPKVTEFVTLPDGATAMDRAAFRGHVDTVKWLQAHTPND